MRQSKIELPVADNGKAQLSLVRPHRDFIQDCGGDPTGSTDQSALLESAMATVAAAGGGVIFFPAGVYLFSRAPQHTAAQNAQVSFPAVGDGGVWNKGAPVGITLIGALEAPFGPAVSVKPYKPAAGYTVFKCTYTGSTSGAPNMLAHPVDAPGSAWINLLRPVIKNIVFEMPPDSKLTCLDVSNGLDPLIQDVMIYGGETDQYTITEPTHATNCGVILQRNNKGGAGTLDRVWIFGQYCGILAAELASIPDAVVWNCKEGLRLDWAHHPCRIGRIGIYECPTSICMTATGSALQNGYLSIEQLNIEDANGRYHPWQDSVIHIADAGDNLHGFARWHRVKAAFGVDHTPLTKTGCTHFTLTEL